MIERIYLLLEIVTYLLIINDLYDKKFKLDFPAVVTIAVEVICFVLAKGGMISDLYLIIPYMLMFFYCKFEFHSKIGTIFVNLILAFMSLGVIQLVIGCLSFFIRNEEICAIVVNTINFILVLFLVKNKIFHKMYFYLKENSKTISYIILYCGFLFLSLMICYFIFGKFTLLEYLLIVMIYVLLIGLVCTWKKEHENLNYKIGELDTFNKYHLREKQFYNDIRKKQHEFKNQLNALYSTHYTCATYEELIAVQKRYADWIMKDNQYNDLLLLCKPSVLAGFIYNQLENAKQQGVQVEYSVSVVDMEDADREYDYICVFGVLFDNAIEAVRNHSSMQRKIECVFIYDGENTKIEMKNISAYIKNKDIQAWFKESFSTKDKNRGYGLSNVINIKNKYNADIIVENVEKQGE